MLPEKFVDRMKNLLPEEEFKAFMESFGENDTRHHALRINMLKMGEDEEIKETASKIEGLGDQVPWEETGFYYDDNATPGKHPYHEAGLYYIQEPSAMAPVHFLDPQPGDRVLDLCAAPGGKSTQIACRLKGEGLLITNEINRDRAKILSLNVERLGIRNAMVVNEDSAHLAERFEGYFDKILVDAPCSGEGMFRKNEQAPTEWSPENVDMCAARQSEILDNAAVMLSPGGRLVYSTCTFAPQENEQNIASFLVRHPDFHTEKVTLIGGMDSGRAEWAGKSEINNDILQEVTDSVRLWPHKLNGEGHFLCVLRRDGEPIAKDTNKFVPGGRFIRAKKDAVKPFEEFAKETLNCTLPGEYLSFGDQLYLAPADMPSPDGLKVLRPGLHLGTIKKDRFEPSHALALALRKEDVKLSVDFSSDSDEIRQYLNGQTLRTGDKSEKGWTLITVDGYSIGWAKAAGGMLKNHYPKGLRINY